MKVLNSKCILNVQFSHSLVDSSRALELVSMGFEASITWASVLVAIGTRWNTMASHATTFACSSAPVLS